jgi:hypothetical protein
MRRRERNRRGRHGDDKAEERREDGRHWETEVECRNRRKRKQNKNGTDHPVYETFTYKLL